MNFRTVFTRAALVVATGVLPSPLHASAPPPHRTDTVPLVLADYHSARIDSVAATRRIESLGAAAGPVIVALLQRGVFQEQMPGGRTARRPVGEHHAAMLLGALEHLPYGPIRAEVERLVAGEPSLGDRVLASRVLAHTAPPTDLLWLAEVLVHEQPTKVRALRPSVEGALSAWTRRDPRVLQRFPAFLEAVHPSLMRSALQGVRAGDASPEVLHALARGLGRSAATDALLLTEIAAEGRTTRRPVRPDTLALVRPSLTSPHRSVRLEAMLALGRLDDVEAVPELIEVLAGDDAAARQRARVALERVTRESLGADHGVWDRWFRASETWRREDMQPLLARLTGANAEASRRALLEIARHRVFRHDLVEPVADALRGPDDGTAEIACAVLGHFGCEDALPALVDALGHPSVEVRKAALMALRRATGKALGDAPEEWRAAGFGRREEDQR